MGLFIFFRVVVTDRLILVVLHSDVHLVYSLYILEDIHNPFVLECCLFAKVKTGLLKL